MNFNIFFISFNESNQETNWSRLLEFHPNSIRLHGIVGINKVHLLADEISETDYFWTVDGDNFLIKKLDWKKEINSDLLMFNAIDPISNQLTNLGGVKLWKKNSMISTTMDKGDFCLNATATKSVVDDYFSYTCYNNSPFDTWKTSFRHCVKLLSPIFKSRPNALNIDRYLNHWKNCQHLDDDKNNAKWAYRGFCDAEEFVKESRNNYQRLSLINNYDWLKEKFKSIREYNEKTF